MTKKQKKKKDNSSITGSFSLELHIPCLHSQIVRRQHLPRLDMVGIG